MKAEADSAPTVSAALAAAAAQLPDTDSPLLDCQLLLAHTLGVDRSWLYAHDADPLKPDTLVAFDALVTRRQRGEPVAYLLGTQAFWNLELEVNSATLIPRADTERLVEVALDELPADEHLRIADLGTGSGAIAIALASERPHWHITATDTSAAALETAARNARRAGCANVTFLNTVWLAEFEPHSLDAIVSNPPYIAADDPHLAALVHEPESALVSGADGLDDIRTIATGARDVLRPGGRLLLEHGHAQQPAVIDWLEKAGFRRVRGFTDLAGQPRVTIGETR